DALLDAAASGVNTVERDGISRQHPARFVLVGTMNPEEGELRPQLLDRFGLSVTLNNPTDAALRQAIVRARLAFEQDPQAALERHAPAQAQLVASIAAARAALVDIPWPEAALQCATELALAAGVDGVRADLVMLRAARALAALGQRPCVEAADVQAVAELALAHRRGAEAPPPGAARPPAPPATPPSTAAAQPPAPDAGRGATPEPEGDWGALPPQA